VSNIHAVQELSLNKELRVIIPEDRIRDRYIDLVSFASDAGFYYLLPKAVVQPVDEKEIIALFKFSRDLKIPLVFRTGGTSLSGQSVTDGILVDLSQFWKNVKTESEGLLVRVQPGITGAMVNAHLKKFHRKIGPDPSSINAAMMGGILSNNASGMCCGVVLNSYHTIKYIRFILPNGKIFSTENLQDYDRFKDECNELYKALAGIRDQIAADPALRGAIRKKYKTKTTIGYSLNAFVDFQDPLDIFAHLLIGAEGTLAFISEAVMVTVPDYPFKSTALLYFPNIYAACKAIIPLANAGALMVELMDRASLRAVQNIAGMPPSVKTLPASAAALLIEFQENTREELESRVVKFMESSAELSMLNAPVFTTDPVEQEFLWRVRKGLFPAVGAVRASGTTVILEDVAFPVEKLGDAILDLQELFKKYDYTNAIIFGHAKDGNIHFVVTQSFNTPQEITRYDHFIRDVVELVVHKYDGTLKAEHGTGRNMAPFVETEWGEDAYAIIKKIKRVADGENLLNPGVIVNGDKNAHIKNLKELPKVEEEVDRCIECGYCEHKCPSRDLTTSPRRRIVIRRVLKSLELSGDNHNYKLLLGQYRYDGMQTCAVDGLCAIACPVDINTGDLIKRLRSENHSTVANKFAMAIARNFKSAEALMRFALRTGNTLNGIFGKNAMVKLTRGLKTLVPILPLWTNQLSSPPRLSALRAKTANGEPGILYFPACISRTLGTYQGKEKNIVETFMSICRKLQMNASVLDEYEGSCCGQIFSSKGFNDAYRFTANRITCQLWTASKKGHLPIVTDVSSCAYTLLQLRPALTEENKIKFDTLRILDSVDFLYDMVLSRAKPVPLRKRVVLHPVCSLQKMRTEQKFIKIAKHFADTVDVPVNTGCCGMAGDRGFLCPELIVSATADEVSEVQQNNYDGYYSTTKTCEMAMSMAAERNYESLLYLVDEGLP
jgi:D-lactate dehydrogenase